MIYLFRHGEIMGADIKRFIGQSDIDLSPVGRRQAMYWQHHLSNIQWDRVFSSSLCRTVEMAGIISGMPPNKIQQVDALGEIDLGQWEGIPFSTIKKKQTAQWEARGADLAGYRPPEGESFSDLAQRAVPAFHQLVTRYTGNLLVVAHAGVNRVILADLLGYELPKLFSIPQAYGCLNRIEKIDSGILIHQINQIPDIDHSPVNTF